MTATEIFKKKSGLTDTDTIKFYILQAGDELRIYLNYDPEDPIDRFSSVVADIAVNDYDYDTRTAANKTAQASQEGLKSESYSEGPVSVSKTYKSTDELYSEYTASKDKILMRTRDYRLARVVKRG